MQESSIYKDVELISFAEFIELDDTTRTYYQTVGALLPPTSWNVGKIGQMEWGKVKEIQFIYSSPNLTYNDLTKVLSIASGEEEKNICRKTWVDVWKFHNFVYKEIERISEMEANYLSYDLTGAEASALEPLGKFGHFATLHGLAGGDPLKMGDIEKLKYDFVFTFLYYEKLKFEAEEKIIKSKQNA